MSRFEGIAVTLSKAARKPSKDYKKDPYEEAEHQYDLTREAILSVQFVADVIDSTQDGLVVVFKNQLRSDERGGWMLRTVAQIKGVEKVEPLSSHSGDYDVRSKIHARLLDLSKEIRAQGPIEPTVEAVMDARVRLEAARELVSVASGIFGLDMKGSREAKALTEAVENLVSAAARR